MQRGGRRQSGVGSVGGRGRVTVGVGRVVAVAMRVVGVAIVGLW